MSVLYSFLILTVLGLLLGLGLAVADKKLSVQKDTKLEELQAIMPGANCGGCGYPGCAGYAEAVFKGEALPGLCSPGGQAVADKMGRIMGIQVSSIEKKVAFVFCHSTERKKEFDYKGLKDCNAVSLLFKGDNLCKEGCLHMLSCASVCEQGAISADEYGNPVVNRNLCIGCGKCTKVCPNNVIRLVPADQEFFVACNNHDLGSVTRKKCESGCIGCKICEVKFPQSGFHVENNLSTFENAKGNSDSKSAMDACPRKCIYKSES